MKNHLNDEEIALYVDALKLNCYKLLPRHMLKHCCKCIPCASQVLELFQVLQNVVYDKKEKHPTFTKKLKMMNR